MCAVKVPTIGTEGLRHQAAEHRPASLHVERAVPAAAAAAAALAAAAARRLQRPLVPDVAPRRFPESRHLGVDGVGVGRQLAGHQLQELGCVSGVCVGRVRAG